MKKLIFTGISLIAWMAGAQSANSDSHSSILKLQKLESQNASIETQHNSLLRLAIENKFKILDAKKVPAKSALGGQDGNGGDSALDSVSGKRKLLDLLEGDQLNYFTPDGNLYDVSISLGLSTLFQRLRAECAYYGEKPNCPQTVRNENSLLALADYSFIYILIKSFGFQSLVSYEPMYEKDYESLSDLAARNETKPPIQKLKWAFVKFDLEEINDEGSIRITNPKTKKQLAIQKDGLVIINQNEFDLLDKTSQAGLFVHEATLRSVLLTNPSLIQNKGTEPVRTFTRRLIQYVLSRKSDGTYTYPSYGVREAYEALEIKLKN